MMKKIVLLLVFAVSVSVSAQVERGVQTFKMGTSIGPVGQTIAVDGRGLIVNGRPVLPVMGEMHYARVPAADWQREVKKMKAGGVTIMATYVFWIHHEDELEGLWDWSGNKNLRKFIEVCAEEQMPVVLRIGPFCHGEAYQGGIPCWIVRKAAADSNYKLRSTAPGFIDATARLYNQIGAQVKGLMWKDGGPIVGIQIENECRGPWSYFMKLMDLAKDAGLDTPIYTRTGWPQMNGRAEFGKILPLYGDYADGFWDRSLTDMPGDYPKAFVMKDTRLSAVIATETFGTDQSTDMDLSDLSYPYLTCELGGGMMASYHRRINMSGREAMPLCVCKLGSGSNLPGYYMYHGGTNPSATLHSMAETQNSTVTNYNDMPLMSYDFQTILGEMGQPDPVSWHETRWVHQFLADWGDVLSSMDVDTLSEHYARRGQFVFRNDYVRILNESGSASITPEGMEWNGLTITSLDVQPFAMADGALYFIALTDKSACRLEVNGKKLTAKADKTLKVNGRNIVVLSKEKARQAYVVDGKMVYADGIVYKEGDRIVAERWTADDKIEVKARMVKAEDTPREVTMGIQKVAAMPADADFDRAAVWTLDVDIDAADASDCFLQIGYRGDCARVYADGVLVEDNFWNGKTMLVRMSELVGKHVELKVLPLRKDAPIYLQEAQRKVLEAAEGSYLIGLDGLTVVRRTVNPV